MCLLSRHAAPTQINFPLLQIFLQGGVDHDGNVNARLNQGWAPSSVTKVQAQASILDAVGFMYS